MQDATKDNIGRRLGVVLVEEKTRTFFDENDNVIQESYTEKNIISNATIQAALGTAFRITGLSSSNEASELALLLRAGALAAPMKFVEEQTIGPTLGQENIDKGLNSVIVGFILVFIFMLIRYRLFGLLQMCAYFKPCPCNCNHVTCRRNFNITWYSRNSFDCRYGC